MRETFRCNP
jgi:serine/threonine protein kinase